MAHPSSPQLPNFSQPGYQPGLSPSTARAKPSDGALADVDIRPFIRHDPWFKRILRRTFTVPALVLFAALWLAVGVFAIPVCVVADLIARRPLLWTRFYVALTVIIVGQLYGVFGMFAVWIASGFGLNYRRCNAWSVKFAGHWGKFNISTLARVYRMKFSVEGSEVLRDGPTILLSRHASIIDTIMPLALVQQPHGVRLRIVLKHELLYSATVDTIGHRVPTAFVRRGSSSLEKELDAVRSMTGGLHSQETVLIFPEGTRYTEQKQRDVRAKLASKDPTAAARAQELTHLLPLRPGGINALIEAVPHADLVFCAHSGFEQGSQLEDFFKGGLYRANVRVKYWRVSAASIPADPAERMEFLHREWLKVNAFVAQHQRKIAANRN